MLGYQTGFGCGSGLLSCHEDMSVYETTGDVTQTPLVSQLPPMGLNLPPHASMNLVW